MIRLIKSLFGAARSPDDPEDAAHRFARLLAAEIRLYDSGLLREARQAGEIPIRLAEKLRRAHQTYAKRTLPSAGARDLFIAETAAVLELDRERVAAAIES